LLSPFLATPSVLAFLPPPSLSWLLLTTTPGLQLSAYGLVPTCLWPEAVAVWPCAHCVSRTGIDQGPADFSGNGQRANIFSQWAMRSLKPLCGSSAEIRQVLCERAVCSIKCDRHCI
jgi:hypothetical protein